MSDRAEARPGPGRLTLGPLRVAVLLVGAALAAWIVAIERMQGMDAGPGTSLGTLGWFLGFWVTMMVAMMLPSAAPMTLLYARSARGRILPVLVFLGGYLAAWTVYFHFLLHRWRNGVTGAARMGAEHGAYCVGCCWGLMLILFALGVMSIFWMALVAGVIFAEKVLPHGSRSTRLLALAFVALGIWIAAAPASVPGLTQPGRMGMR